MLGLRKIGILCLCTAAILGAGNGRAAESPADAKSSVLYLRDGDYFRGRLADSSTPNTIRWLAQGAVEPFEFTVDAFRGAYFASSGAASDPAGEYCFELNDGDLLYGSLLEITDDHLGVESAQFGRLQIARSEVNRLTPLQSSAFEYRGPNGLGEWVVEGKRPWREEAGRLISTERGAAIHKVISIPHQAHFEFEISWTKAPKFTLTFCSNQKKDQQDEGFRLEVWDQKLVLVREINNDADVSIVMDLDRNASRVHLEAYYDFAAGEFSVQALDGKQLAKVTLPKKGAVAPKCIRLINGGAEICLEQLMVGKWNGQAPPQIDTSKPRIHKNDGSIIYGELTSYDATTKQFVVRSEGAESRLNAAEVIGVTLLPTKSQNSPTVRIGMDDGSRFSGELAKLEGDKLYLKRHGIDQPLACAVARIRSLNSLTRATRSIPTIKERIGRWESDGILSHGSLVTSSENKSDQASSLTWKPRESATASALASTASGKIIYRDPPPTVKETEEARMLRLQQQQQRQRPVGFVGAIANVFTNSRPALQPTKPEGAATLCLVTGDRLPCKAAEIDEEGIHFVSSVVTSRLVPHSAAKALEFVPQWTAMGLAEEKKLRLLTLPRMQKGNPPTHLVISTSGDFLRGRLSAMNAVTATVETRLETKQLLRDRVACVIWLHEEKEAPPTDEAAAKLTSLLVQAVQSDGIRLTFNLKECTDAKLLGVSDALGDCQVQINGIDQLVFGAMIKKVAAEQLYGAWKLTDATEPLFMHEGEGGTKPDGSGGSGSVMVGKAAPDFKLDLADGGPFKLAEQKGSVVVLDFWASWCGPCMQAMPQTDAVVEEFKDRKVKLVAVNMQEDKTTINGALERLKIHPTVAMDIDGAIAERYQVSAIPQIVVIDTDSNVAEVMIGVSPGFADQLRGAIQKALEPKAEPATKAAPAAKAAKAAP